MSAAVSAVNKLHQSDLQLAAAVLARDRKATARLVELHTDAVYRYVWRRLNPRLEMVDDIVQESFVAAWKALRTYTGESSLQTWLIGVARFKVEDHYRRTLGRSLLEMETGEDIPGNEDLQASVEGAEQAARVLSVLSKMSYDYAIALRWRYWEGRPAKEIAMASGRTEKAVERLLARARQQFREKWLTGLQGKERQCSTI